MSVVGQPCDYTHPVGAQLAAAPGPDTALPLATLGAPQGHLSSGFHEHPCRL